MEIVTNTKNVKLPFLKNVENCFRELGQKAKKFCLLHFYMLISQKNILNYLYIVLFFLEVLSLLHKHS